MATSKRFASAIHAPAQHAEHVYQVAQGDAPAPGMEEVSTSWQRSANKYGVDPVDSTAPRIVTAQELKGLREPIEKLIFNVQEELDRLYKVVRKAGYAVLFCDTTGVAVEHRGEDTEADQFKYWGTWLGGMWSEAIEGTNGIGTCIAEERPVTVHRSQHFRSRHIDLSCSGAPVFDVDGKLMAILDVSAINPELSERAHALTGALTVTAARDIEERFFREHFLHEWIIALALPEETDPAVLLAIDGNQRILGANRAARACLMLDDPTLEAGLSLWSIFERDLSPFRRKDNNDISTRLVIAGSSETCSALVTPPASALGTWRDPATIALHTRSRLAVLGSLVQPAPIPRARGGLSPSTMRRVQEYIDAHLSEPIDLGMLARTAGLSLFHFAREFKQSAGVTPHHYLVQRRISSAQKMLVRTELSLSEVALAVGFSDQSHLARHFRHILGTTPRDFRWSQR
jgi:AraC-like DNA-binding protein